MITRRYPVVIERGMDDAGTVGYGIFFPDFPGCVSAGESIDDALTGAEEALTAHVALMVKDGDPLPLPSPLDTIPHDPEVDEVLRTLVRVDIPARWVRVNISLEETLLARIDAAARDMGVTRSNFLAVAARRVVDAA